MDDVNTAMYRTLVPQSLGKDKNLPWVSLREMVRPSLGPWADVSMTVFSSQMFTAWVCSPIKNP